MDGASTKGDVRGEQRAGNARESGTHHRMDLGSGHAGQRWANQNGGLGLAQEYACSGVQTLRRRCPNRALGNGSQTRENGLNDAEMVEKRLK